ncbi:hypothetical protein TPY_3168 [Sulfobacillus acidophilus TPY]|nr:hypothetical protein TPY_3168 [Sulfobacillus acidophilus TPY]
MAGHERQPTSPPGTNLPSAIGRIRLLAEDALRRGSSRLLGKLLAMSLTLANEPRYEG